MSISSPLIIDHQGRPRFVHQPTELIGPEHLLQRYVDHAALEQRRKYPLRHIDRSRVNHRAKSRWALNGPTVIFAPMSTLTPIYSRVRITGCLCASGTFSAIGLSR